MKLRKTIVLSILGIILVTNVSIAQEAKFKALFLNKFVQYIEWPNEEEKTTIGVLGTSDVYDELVSLLKNKTSVEVIQIFSTDEYTKCDLVYVPMYLAAFVGELNTRVGNESVLIVSDDKNHAGVSADIGFYIKDQRLLFKIDPEKIKAKKMEASSRLINLGKLT